MTSQVYRSILPVLPPAPLWVTGRFYDQFVLVSSYASVSVGGNCYLEPIYVPNQITATSIGVEVTATTSDGRSARFGIYRSGDDGLPSTLLLDAGLVVTDTTAFASATISQRLIPGWYWLAMANQTTTSVRGINPGTSLSIYSGANLQVPNLAAPNCIFLSQGILIKNGGWPYQFYSIVNAAETISVNVGLIPRLMIGV